VNAATINSMKSAGLDAALIAKTGIDAGSPLDLLIQILGEKAVHEAQIQIASKAAEITKAAVAAERKRAAVRKAAGKAKPAGHTMLTRAMDRAWAALTVAICEFETDYQGQDIPALDLPALDLPSAPADDATAEVKAAHAAAIKAAQIKHGEVVRAMRSKRACDWLSTIPHPDGSAHTGTTTNVFGREYTRIKGQVGIKPGRFNDLAINMTVRLDANQPSRAKK